MTDKPQYGQRTPTEEPRSMFNQLNEKPWATEPEVKLPSMMPPQKPKREATPMSAASWVLLAMFAALLAPPVVWLWRWALGML